MVLVLFLTRFSCVSDPHTTTTLLRLRYLYLQLQLQFILLHLKFQFKRNKHTRTRTQSEHDMERIENDKTVNAAYDFHLICLFISFSILTSSFIVVIVATWPLYSALFAMRFFSLFAYRSFAHFESLHFVLNFLSMSRA